MQRSSKDGKALHFSPVVPGFARCCTANVLPNLPHQRFPLDSNSIRFATSLQKTSWVQCVPSPKWDMRWLSSTHRTMTGRPSYAKEVRKLLNDLGIHCLSTHNSATALGPEGLDKAIELNQILGSKFIVMASAGRVRGLDGWKAVGDTLTRASEKLVPLGMRAGFHNHKLEFVPLDDKRPMEVIAAHTPKEVMLQLDVGTCVDAGSDPIAWIKEHPGRINSLHCKDWAAGEGKGYRVLFGEGESPWKGIIGAAETVGGVEFYLIEQEGSRYPAMETAERCLATWRKLKG